MSQCCNNMRNLDKNRRFQSFTVRSFNQAACCHHDHKTIAVGWDTEHLMSQCCNNKSMIAIVHSGCLLWPCSQLWLPIAWYRLDSVSAYSSQTLGRRKNAIWTVPTLPSAMRAKGTSHSDKLCSLLGRHERPHVPLSAALDYTIQCVSHVCLVFGWCVSVCRCACLVGMHASGRKNKE